jgi:hypothetical protein
MLLRKQEQWSGHGQGSQKLTEGFRRGVAGRPSERNPVNPQQLETHSNWKINAITPPTGDLIRITPTPGKRCMPMGRPNQSFAVVGNQTEYRFGPDRGKPRGNRNWTCNDLGRKLLPNDQYFNHNALIWEETKIAIG